MNLDQNIYSLYNSIIYIFIVDFNTKNVISLINKIFVILYLNKEYGTYKSFLLNFLLILFEKKLSKKIISKILNINIKNYNRKKNCF